MDPHHLAIGNYSDTDFRIILAQIGGRRVAPVQKKHVITSLTLLVIAMHLYA